MFFYLRKLLKYILPIKMMQSLLRFFRKLVLWPPVNFVRFGSFKRLSPISNVFGLDRGFPVDRYYIEDFLEENCNLIYGHVLEIGDNIYTKKYGDNKVTKSDILHAVEGNKKANIVADLTKASHIPSNTYDCIILTQTLQFIFDLQAAIKTIHRILAPGGTLLVTIPGISRVSSYDMDRWGDYWRFTSLSAQRIFEDLFPLENINVKSYGNVLTAITSLHGLAASELKTSELNKVDVNYEVIISIRVMKSK